MAWYNKRKLCEHCREKKTRSDFEGVPTCGACKIKLLIEREKIHACPVDGADMCKEDVSGIIIDRCPACGGIWLDAEELDHIKKIAGDEKLATGLVVGMVIG